MVFIFHVCRVHESSGTTTGQKWQSPIFVVVTLCVQAPYDEPDLCCQRVASLGMRLAKVLGLGESG